MLLSAASYGSVPRTRRTIEAAADAMVGWTALAARDRAAILRRMHDLMLIEREALARMLTEEQGKPLTEARCEIAHSAAFFGWFGEKAKRAYGDVMPGHAADKRILVLRQSIRVIAAITPWNLPSAIIARKVTPTLAAGCVVVVKPAEQASFSVLALAVIAERAGLSPCLFSV